LYEKKHKIRGGGGQGGSPCAKAEATHPSVRSDVRTLGQDLGGNPLWGAKKEGVGTEKALAGQRKWRRIFGADTRSL